MKKDIKQIISKQPLVKNIISGKNSIDEYIDKIMNNATIIPYYSCSYLEGLVAYYANDVLKKDAYLTLIIIDKKKQEEGLGKLLLKASISDLINRGYSNYRLKVVKSNVNAIEFYKKYGFNIENEAEDSYLMKLNLKEYDVS
jgi:ribosomal protein S18 acetylase RimI-like enzyme